MVAACLKLDQPKTAYEFAQQIINWRKGSCIAEIALYCAEKNNVEPIDYLLHEAEQTANEYEDWQTDNIHVKIAQTYARLEQYEKAGEYEQNVMDSEQGKVVQIKAQNLDEVLLEEVQQHLNTLMASGSFDVIKNALFAYVELYNRFYQSEIHRAHIFNRIQSSWKLLPILIRIEILMKLADTAINHSDESNALKLLSNIEAYIGAYEWPLETHLPLMAKLSKKLYQAGEKENAIALADKTFASYQEKGKQIVTIWRAGALRPLAETFHAIGETETAMHIYKLAIEEGMENPNSRPRAEDMSAVCVSMALHRVEPDEQLWARILEIQKGLSAPW